MLRFCRPDRKAPPLAYLFALLLAGYVAILIGMSVFEERLVFAPTGAEDGDFEFPENHPDEVQEVWLETELGEKIHAWLFVPDEEPTAEILFFHGNAGNLTGRTDWCRRLRRRGARILILDYPGYGLSPGSPNEPGLYRAGEAGYAYLREVLKVPAEDIIFYGKSLGGGVASEMALRHPGLGLVLQSTYTTIPDVGAGRYPFLPCRTLARNRFETAAKIPQIEAPILIFHSRADEVIPFSHGEKLAEIAGDRGEFHAYSDALHSGLIDAKGEELLDHLFGFFARARAERYRPANLEESP